MYGLYGEYGADCDYCGQQQRKGRFEDLFRGAPPFPYMLSFCLHSTMINNSALIIKAAKVKVWLIFFGLFPFLLKREEGSYTFPSLFFMVFSTALSIFS